MIVLEFKLKGKPQQYRIVDEMIRTAQFVRNKALRYWMDNRSVQLPDLYKQCAVMAKEFKWAGKLNSMARQASAERALMAIQRFLIARLKSRERKGIHSSRNSLVLWSTKLQDGNFLLIRNVSLSLTVLRLAHSS